MKKIQLLISSLLVLILSACNNSVSVTPQTIPATQTITPATEIPSTPTLQTIALDTPAIGSTISWFDTSTLVFVPEGESIMGADESKEQDFNPAHTVALDKFWIYSTKVTHEMYNLCVSAGQCVPPASDSAEPVSTFVGSSIYLVGSDPNELGGKDFPVTDVTWDQASAYCQWAGGRLPTEAEWEKTARGTTNQAYPWGDASPSCDLLNFGGCSGFLNGVLDHPAGMSEYKALDMAGNAFEWVSDWYQADYYAQSPSVNPAGPEAGTARSVRGSSFESTADAIPSFVRHSLDPDQHKVDLGFRCVIPDTTIFAPMCSVPAQITMDSSTPQAGSPLSGKSVSSNKVLTINLDNLINSQVTSYCVDKKSNLGGALLDQDFSQYDKFIISNCDSWFYYVYYNFPPKVVNAGGSNNWPIYKTGYVGPEGTAIELKPVLDCSPKQGLSAPPHQGVSAVCAAGYTLQPNGVCQYVGSSGTPGNITCPTGYNYSQQSQCCTVNPSLTGNSPIQYPACGPGNIFDSQNQACYKSPSAIQSFVSTATPIQFNLGTCQDIPRDKPQQPPPCTIDPATGACN